MNYPLLEIRRWTQQALRPLGLLVAWLLAFCSSLVAQSVATFSNTVMTFDVKKPLDHTDTLYSRWLKDDGTFVDITKKLIQSDFNLGPLAGESGTWKFVPGAAGSGTLSFISSNGSGIPPAFTVAFAAAATGTLTAVDFAIQGAGSFTLRPAQTEPGPINLSTRAFVSTSGATIAGFVITGTEKRFVLLRAVGPGLTQFGVPSAAAKMSVNLYGATGSLVAATEDWAASTSSTQMYQNLFAMAGAFPLSAGQGDACIVLELPAGTYSASMSASTSGNALIEIYFLP